ncbi:hypothetical protein Daud_1683 [Candidatus Desulforudis audaxviator MP104C]|uniref:Uncharacterized protein n=1 Tax=Desulforudis audaxviator (strain MP104C) TaxID=477974 RepID=B1I6T8_DESAP|nr:hypothetical protein Daud_1683 [Candidatus Desulforudis audaxviator MP104C]
MRIGWLLPGFTRLCTVLTPSFGATGATDAFLVAFLIPYAFYGVVGLALATVIVPQNLGGC